jgi:hypothetical protein
LHARATERAFGNYRNILCTSLELIPIEAPHLSECTGEIGSPDLPTDLETGISTRATIEW